MHRSTLAWRIIKAHIRILATSKWRSGSFLSFFNHLFFLKCSCYSFLWAYSPNVSPITIKLNAVPRWPLPHETRRDLRYAFYTVIDFRWSTRAGTAWVGHRAAATDGEMAGNNPEHCYDKLESQLLSLPITVAWPYGGVTSVTKQGVAET